MRIMMLLLLTLSSWRVKGNLEAPESPDSFEIYDPETGEKLDDRGIIEKQKERHETSSTSRPVPKEGFRATVYFAYNDATLDMYGNETEKMIKRIFGLVARKFQDDKLGVKINLTLGGYGHWPMVTMYNSTTQIEGKYLIKKMDKIITNGSIDQSMNHYAMLAGDWVGRTAGVATLDGFCARVGLRASINKVDPSREDHTVRIVSHEIAHALGIRHDFGRGKNVTCEDYRIMSYKWYPLPTTWSDCSQSDFRRNYNNHVIKFGRYCLPPNECVCNPKGSVGLGCDDRNYCKCKQGYLGAKCDICWKWSENLGTEDEPECGCIFKNIKIWYAEIKIIQDTSVGVCQQLCVDNAYCSHFTFRTDLKSCTLSGFKAVRREVVGMIAGTRFCAEKAADIKKCIEEDTDYPGWDMKYGKSIKASADLCQISCQARSECDAWSFNTTDKVCSKKSMTEGFDSDINGISGLRNCSQIQPIKPSTIDCDCYPKGTLKCGVDENYKCKSTCKPKYEGAKCNKCWSSVENVGTDDAPDCGCIMKNHYISGGTLFPVTKVASFEACNQICVKTPDCSHFYFIIGNKVCWLLGFKGIRRVVDGVFAGTTICAENAEDITICIEENIDYPGYDIASDTRNTADLCQKSCTPTSGCDAWAWTSSNKVCRRKSLLIGLTEFPGYISGERNCPQIQQPDGPLIDCGCYAKGTLDCSIDERFKCKPTKCKIGYEGARCNECIPGVNNFGTDKAPDCGCLLKNYFIEGLILDRIGKVVSFEACHKLCVNNRDCSYFTYWIDEKICYPKGFKAIRKNVVGIIAGTTICAENAEDITICIEHDIDYPGRDIASDKRHSAVLCQKSCQDTSGCDAWSFEPTKKHCSRKSVSVKSYTSSGYITGVRNCPEFQQHKV